MPDFAAARRMMVDGQVRTADVTDLRIIAAMLDVPRERFMPAAKAALAYSDLAIPIVEAGEGRPARALLKPMVLAKLIHALQPGEHERVLDVGCASGYGAALLARLGGSVVALEEDPSLAREARQVLADYSNVEPVHGNLAAGWQPGAPYEAILIEGAIEVLPRALAEQLAEGGRLACIFGRGPAAKATLFRKDIGEISTRPIFDAAGSVLPGFAEAPSFVF
jgi:protein-L-isoaspartate(D-aspartate) O-methyltransferase